MKKISLNDEQLFALEKNLEYFGIKRPFIKKSLGLTEVCLSKTKSRASSYEEAKSIWSRSAQRSKEERAALVSMIKFALEEEYSEELLLDTFNCAMMSINQIGKMLVIRAMAQLILKEELALVA